MVELREAQNYAQSIVRRFVSSFYPAAEVVLVDYLVNAGYALTTGAIPEHLGVEKTQVKKGLEARLLPDLILEKEIIGTNLEAEEYRFLGFPRFPVCGQYSSARTSQVQIDNEPDNEPTQLVRPDFVGAWLTDLNVRFEIGGQDLPLSSDTLSFEDRQNIRISQALT